MNLAPNDPALPPLPSRPLTDQEALAWMRQTLLSDASDAGARWAAQVYLAIEHFAGPVGNGAAPSPIAVEIATMFAVDMIENAERMAADAECSATERRRLIVERVMVYRDRLAHLFMTAHPLQRA